MGSALTPYYANQSYGQCPARGQTDGFIQTKALEGDKFEKRACSEQGLIDYSIPGNRLVERYGNIELIPHDPAFVFGQKVLKPFMQSSASLCRYVWSSFTGSVLKVNSVVSEMFNFVPSVQAEVVLEQKEKANNNPHSVTNSASYEIDTSLLNMVRETLNERWKELGYRAPQDMLWYQWGPWKMQNEGEKELAITLKIYTKLALSSLENHETAMLESLSEESVVRIKDFVTKYADRFWGVCTSGFPFSKIESSDEREETLDIAISHEYGLDVMLHKLEKRGFWDKEELEFFAPFSYDGTGRLQVVCSDFAYHYFEKGDNKAGYYLLRIIKEESGANFEIPSKEAFDDASVRKILSQFFSSSTPSIKYPTRLLDMLYHTLNGHGLKPAGMPWNYFLEPSCQLNFFNFTLNQMRSVAMSEGWPYKIYVIEGLARSLNDQYKIDFAEALKSSVDPDTAVIGKHMVDALKSASLKEIETHIRAIRQVSPSFSDVAFELFLGKPCTHFRDEFTHELYLDRSVAVVTVNPLFKATLMVGDVMLAVYRSPFPMPTYLLAYNMNTEELEWGMPLTSGHSEDLSLNPIQPLMPTENCRLTQVGKGVTLQFSGQQTLDFIDIATGQTKSTILLPYEHNDHDYLHLTSSGIGYQMVWVNGGRKLVGGTISDSKLSPIFEVDVSQGDFHFVPLSTHVGLDHFAEKKLTIFGPSGKRIILDCMSAYAVGDKLYLVEPNPLKENTCKLTIRTLTTDERVVSGIERSIILNVKTASIKILCDNGELILFNTSYPNAPIFVSLNSEKITYGEECQCRPSSLYVNNVSGEIWHWYGNSDKIFKTSSKERTFVGTWQHLRKESSILYVDANSTIYMNDR